MYKSHIQFYRHPNLKKSGVKWRRKGRTYGMIFDGYLTEQELLDKIKHV